MGEVGLIRAQDGLPKQAKAGTTDGGGDQRSMNEPRWRCSHSGHATQSSRRKGGVGGWGAWMLGVNEC